MPEGLPAERLQPSLLDRLTDDEPGKRTEAVERNVISSSRLRQIVLRDIGWLLGTGNLATTNDLSPWPEVAKSVINYGVPDWSGVSVAKLDAANLARALREAILHFEPRILPRLLRVVATNERSDTDGRPLHFRIEGQLWSTPGPIRIAFKTELDLDSMRVNVTEHAG